MKETGLVGCRFTTLRSLEIASCSIEEATDKGKIQLPLQLPIHLLCESMIMIDKADCESMEKEVGIKRVRKLSCYLR